MQVYYPKLHTMAHKGLPIIVFTASKSKEKSGSIFFVSEPSLDTHKTHVFCVLTMGTHYTPEFMSFDTGHSSYICRTSIDTVHSSDTFSVY